MAVQFVHTDLGKPELATQAGEPVAVSLAHDARYCVAAAGSGDLGVDVEPIGHRTLDEWQALLGPARAPLLAELQQQEPVDRSGTRLWVAGECGVKSLGVPTPVLSILNRDGDAVLFQASTADGRACQVLTAPVLLTLGAERMLGVVVEPDEEDEVPSDIDGQPPSRWLAGTGIDAHAFAMDADRRTRAFILRWPLTFKEGASLNRGVYFTHYADWMGKVRETAMQPIVQPLVELLGSGRWGMVTNASSLTVLDDARLGDTVEARCWTRRAPDQPDSTIDLHFEWQRVERRGRRVPLAQADMRTSWVALTGHGQVRPAPLPTFFQRFLAARTPPPGEQARFGSQPQPLGSDALPPLLYQVPPGPERGPLLAQATFSTSLQDANAVGNIYFSNYYVWQSRLLDRFVQPLVPRAYRSAGRDGELRAVRAQVQHLSEAMPFDEIEVLMSLHAYSARGATFAFDYFRVQPDGSRQKIATGALEAVWLVGAPGVSEPADLPAALLEALSCSCER